MDKTKVKHGFAALLTLSALLFIYVTLVECVHAEQESQDESYAESHTYRYELGQTAVLDSAEDEEGRAYGWTGPLSWDGVMNVTLENVAVLSPDDAALKGKVDVESVESESEYYEEAGYGKLVVAAVTLRVENVNAESINSGSGKYKFCINNFDLLDSDDSEYAYFDESMDPGGRSEAFFVLKKGRAKTLHIGLLVAEKFLEDGLELGLGTDGGSGKYAYAISADQIKRVAS